MTFLPLTQKPTDIVSLLTCEENFKFQEILSETNIENIPQLQKSQQVIQKLRNISKQQRDYRIKLLQQRLYQLSIVQNFQTFAEEYKDYKAHFSINGRGILIKIISPNGDTWEKQTQTFINFQASREFRLIVNQKQAKLEPAQTHQPTPPTPQPLTENQKRWQILNLLQEGDRILYKGRIGTYKGVQECAMPSAWVFFTDSQITEPINPLDFIKVDSNNNNPTPHLSSNLNLDKVDNLTLTQHTNSSEKSGTIVDFTPLHKQNFLHPLVCNNSQKSTFPLELHQLNKPEIVTSENNLIQLPLASSNLNSKILPFRPRTPEEQLSKEEVEKIITFINSNSQQLQALPQIQKRSNEIIRYYLILLDEGKGYTQLGFQNMTALLNSNIIIGSRSNLQKQWQAGRLERDYLEVEPGTIPEDHCRKLAALKAYPEQIQKAYAYAQKLAGDKGRVTAKLVQQAVQEIAQHAGIELPLPKLQKKTDHLCNQNYPNNTNYKIDVCGVEHNLQDCYTQACTQLEEEAKKCQSTPENLIVLGLIKLITQSTELTESQTLTKAVEIALTLIKTDIAA